MLNNIASIYTLRNLLSYVDEKIKLELVIFNKDMQNKLDINIINYKLFKGK